MAIVPHFNGGESIPVSRTARPAIDRERRPQVDAGSIMAALGQGAQSIAASAVQTPTMPVGTFDGQYQGAQAFAAGLSNLGDAFTRIELARVEAKNYADVQETLTGARVLIGEFDIWKSQPENSDPEKAEPEFRRRMEAFAKNYQSRKDLSQQARAQIDARLSSMVQLEGLRVKAEATTATMRRAHEAGMASYKMAKNEGRLKDAITTLDEMTEQGHLNVDERATLEISARDDIEAAQLDSIKTQVDTALMRGELDKAKALINSGPASKEEKENQIANVELIHEVNVRQSELYEDAFFDPDSVIERLEKRNGENFENDAILSFEKRYEVLNFAKKKKNENRVGAFNRLHEDILTGHAKTEKELANLDGWNELTDTDRLQLTQTLREGIPNSPAEYGKALTSIVQFDPAKDETGLAKADLLTMIKARFKGDYAAELTARLNEKVDTYDKAKEVGGMFGPVDGMKLTRTVGDIYQIMDEEFDNEVFGSFMVPAKKAKMSPVDRARYEAREITSNDLVVDVELMRKASEQYLEIKTIVEAAEKSGEAKTPAELYDIFKRETAKFHDEGATKTLNSLLPTGTGIGGEASLFPAGQTKEAVESADELIKRYANP